MLARAVTGEVRTTAALPNPMSSRDRGQGSSNTSILDMTAACETRKTRDREFWPIFVVDMQTLYLWLNRRSRSWDQLNVAKTAPVAERDIGMFNVTYATTRQIPRRPLTVIFGITVFTSFRAMKNRPTGLMLCTVYIHTNAHDSA